MNILVTVGTTPFPELFLSIQDISKTSWLFTCQTAEDKLYDGLNCFNFSNNIEDFEKNSDLIISHAGAGSIYKYLENGVRILVVPNLFRVDQHQMDIATYCKKNNFCGVCTDLNDIERSIEVTVSTEYEKYIKEDFFAAKEINSRINRWVL